MAKSQVITEEQIEQFRQLRLPAHPQFEDLTGRSFGDRTVTCYAGAKPPHQMWLCLCKCGRYSVIQANNIKNGRATRCRSCSNREVKPTHGLRRTREYGIWHHMIDRCHNETDGAFPDYGARGIRVCLGWRSSVVNFVADMGKRLSPKHQIDRINNNGHYSCGHCEECLANGWPANCRWATQKTQARNRRNSHYLTFRGQTKLLIEWAEELDMNPGTLLSRIIMGWSVERALTEPVATRKLVGT